MHVLSTYFNNKKLVDEMVQSNYLCVISNVKCKKKVLILSTVFTWFLIFDKIQDGHQNSSSCREDQRLSTEGKIVSKYCNISKTQGGVFRPPPPPCTTVGVWLFVYVRGLKQLRWLVKTRHVHELCLSDWNWCDTSPCFWLWRWLPHRLSKRQSL